MEGSIINVQKLLIARQLSEKERLRWENAFFLRLLDRMKANAKPTRKRSR